MSAERVASELTVAILPLGEILTSQIILTEDVLKREFGVKTIVLPAMDIPVECFDFEQNEYRMGMVMAFLFLQLPVNAQRIIGIIRGHLGMGEENNIPNIKLGFARSVSRAAIYSSPDISEQQSNQENNQLGGKISHHLIVHEFAHTFGIGHCTHPECAMHESELKTTLCDSCRRWADRELRVVPGSAEERFSLAESLMRHNCLDEAIAMYHEAISSAPHEPLYHTRLGGALFKAGLNEPADHQMILAAIIAKDNADFDYNFGIAYLDIELEQAEDRFAKAITSAKDPRLTQKLIGQAYREITHDVERASRHYLEYLRLGGDDQDVVDWLVSRSKLEKK